MLMPTGLAHGFTSRPLPARLPHRICHRRRPLPPPDFAHKTHVWSNDGGDDTRALVAIVVVGHAPSKDAVDRLLDMADACKKHKASQPTCEVN